MRVYIRKITKRTEQQKPDLYDFTSTIPAAWNWPTKEAAERAARIFSEVGITVDHPSGERALCSEYQVEERPEGGWAISCEYPFSDDPLKDKGEAEAPPGA